MAKGQVKRESETWMHTAYTIKQNVSVYLAGSDQTTWNVITMEIAAIS